MQVTALNEGLLYFSIIMIVRTFKHITTEYSLVNVNSVRLIDISNSSSG